MLAPVFYLIWLLIYSTFFYEGETYQRNKLGKFYPTLNSEQPKFKKLQRGEYLAKAGNCISCHTAGDGKHNVFAGGLMLDTPFGRIPSTNITPDLKTGIGKWSEADFVKAMQHGVSPSGSNYYPAFPYLYFSNLTTNDLSALYLYFRSIPAINKQNLTPEFPLNIWGVRKFVSLWNLMGFAAKPNLTKAGNAQLKRGQYLVNGLGHCGMCHTTVNMFGVPKNNYYLSGGFVGGFWAPNINKYGLAGTDIKELVSVLKNAVLMNNAGPLAGPMADVSHNSLQFLTDDDGAAIATYLKSVESTNLLSILPTVDSSAAANMGRGEIVYAQVCMVCHQNGRVSAPKIGSTGSWFNRLKTVGIDKLNKRTIDGFNNMPKRGGCVNCTDNDIKSAVGYIIYKSLTPSQLKQVQGKK